MTETLQEKIANASAEPGVYLMKDAAGNVIYVGKASNLKKRLASYFTRSHGKPGQLDMKTAVLIKKIAHFEIIITKTEKEALILESNLIKRYRPRYNVILKDDKRYPSLRLDIQSPYPNLRIVRKIAKDGALYFGPYASSHAVRQTLKFIDKNFKLRKCRTRDFKTRTRPCLHCQMQKCLAPCCLDVDRGVYDEMVKEVILFLKGRTPELIRKLKKDMKSAANSQDFEKAAALRDRVFALEKTLEKQVAVTTDFKDRDVLAIAGSPAFSLITVLSVRGGYLMGARHFTFSETMSNATETIGTFIRQYYEKAHFIPKEILVSVAVEDQPLLEDRLKELKGAKVCIWRPQRGERLRLVRMAEHNAESGLEEMILARAADTDILVRLRQRLKLTHLPRHIECFDNSNIAGTEPVASMVVFENGKPKKSAYRKYKIKSVPQQNDYAYMAEVLKRRYGKGEKSNPFPDLMVVDGGKGQLNIAVSVIKELNLEGGFDVLGIAKKDENRGDVEDKIFKPGRANPLNFGTEGDLLLFLQRVRDEAHRFAVSFHRKRRNRAALQSALDGIPGIGKKRKELLLKHFGGVKKIRTATLEELSALPGMNRKAADAVKTSLSQ